MKHFYPATFLDKVNEIIQQNLDNELLSTNLLAKLLPWSNSQVYRKIKQATGLSPSVYIRNIRLEQSRALIERSDLTLSEIAYRMGFSCLSYYSRCFSDYFGYPPSSLRIANNKLYC